MRAGDQKPGCNLEWPKSRVLELILALHLYVCLFILLLQICVWLFILLFSMSTRLVYLRVSHIDSIYLHWLLCKALYYSTPTVFHSPTNSGRIPLGCGESV